jgi:trans-feruloyl-CoA hydratase/vanillin synthase
MPWDMADDYLLAKSSQARLLDQSGGRAKGLKQFLDDKSYKPGLQAYRRDD